MNENKDMSTDNPLTRKVIINKIKERHPEMQRIDVIEMVDEVLGEIRKAIVLGKEIELRGLFTGKMVFRKAKLGMNMHTRKKIAIEASNRYVMKLSSTIQEELGRRFPVAQEEHLTSSHD